VSKVWVIGSDGLERIAELEPLKVFKEKDDAFNYYNSRHISEVSIVEAELVWVVPPIFPLPPSEYICMKCGDYRPNWFKLCYQDNLFNANKAWCDTCKEDTGYRKVSEPGSYCLLEKKCAECGKVVGDITEPITDGACSIIYACYECAEKRKGYIQTLKPPKEYQPATSITNVDELKEKFGLPQENKNEI
jgi:hypothetical protein